MVFLTKSAAIAAFALSVSAFKLPIDQPDGLYMHSTNSSGHTVSKLVQAKGNQPDSNTQGPTSRHSRLARAAGWHVTKTGCEQFGGNPLNEYSARTQLGRWCDYNRHSNELSKDTHMSYQDAGAVVYVCTTGGNQGCGSDELSSAMVSVHKACPSSQGGWAYDGDWKKTYGVTRPGASVCDQEGEV